MARITQYLDTPNPHALKCVLSEPLARPGGAPEIRSYTSKAAAQVDPAAAALLDVQGVQSVLIGAGWITIGKDQSASWKSLKPALEKCIGAFA